MTIFSGVLAGPIKLGDAAPGHHQASLQVAVAADGRFVVLWLDSLFHEDQFVPPLDLYIRFFDKDGNPMTDAYKIPKLVDTAWVNLQSMDMDSAGNTVVAWVENKTLSAELLSKIRFMSFAPDGSPLTPSKTLYSDIDMGFPVSVSLSNKGAFALCFKTILRDSSGAWIQRFDLSGNPLDSAFLAYDTLPDTFEGSYRLVKNSLNDEGDIVVTWLHKIETSRMYPFYQVFDSLDKPVNWAPLGHRLDKGDSRCGSCSPHPYWVDNDRFAAFWSDYCHPNGPGGSLPILGRVFSDRGLTPHEICTVAWGDSLHVAPDTRDPFTTSLSSSGKFAYTHERMYSFLDSITDPHQWKSHSWSHDAGFLGEIVDDEPHRRTNLFEYTPPWGEDTVWCVSRWAAPARLQKPAVACNDDRIVWVYSRLNTDTIFEAYALVTDWNMGVGVQDKPTITTPSNFTLLSPIGSEIVLRYEGMPGGFRAIVYDASGRQVDEIKSTAASGTIEWGKCYGPGVYFIVPDAGSKQVAKVVLVK